MRDYLALQHQMIGKTGTAEILFHPYAYPSSLPQMYKHIWFGALCFPATSLLWENPELVVVVFLRFGSSGKEAAPLAAAMLRQWRAIQARHASHQ
jgi:cell division protein FtsI/penicillin-binding protein 2